MGRIIRRAASAERILADVKMTLAQATAKGGVFRELAEQRLGAAVAHLDGVLGQLRVAQDSLRPMRAQIRARYDEAALVVGRVSDEVWNAVGRPASDMALAMLFPGGIQHYVGAGVGSTPDRLDLLAKLLQSGVHWRLPKDVAKAGAADVSSAAAALRAAIDAGRAPQALVDRLESVSRVNAANAQLALASLKRLYLAAGFSEAEIHAVIPDRPRAPAAKAPPPDVGPETT